MKFIFLSFVDGRVYCNFIQLSNISLVFVDWVGGSQVERKKMGRT